VKNLKWSLYLVALVSLLFVFMTGTVLAQDDPVHPCCDRVPSSHANIVDSAMISPVALTATAPQFSLTSRHVAAQVAARPFGEQSEVMLTQPDVLADRTAASTSAPEGSAWYGYRRLS
jgi:hypothetical protein